MPTDLQDVDGAAEDPVEGDNLAYTVHFYANTHKQVCDFAFFVGGEGVGGCWALGVSHIPTHGLLDLQAACGIACPHLLKTSVSPWFWERKLPTVWYRAVANLPVAQELREKVTKALEAGFGEFRV